MITFMASLFIKDSKNYKEPSVRQAYGVLSGAVGIGLNILLFFGKWLAGTISGSIAITADAFNNLSDAGSSIITLIGFRLFRTGTGSGASIWTWKNGIYFWSSGVRCNSCHGI